MREEEWTGKQVKIKELVMQKIRGMYSISGRRLKDEREVKRGQEQPMRFALISTLERLQESLKDSLKVQVNAFKEKNLKIT